MYDYELGDFQKVKDYFEELRKHKKATKLSSDNTKETWRYKRAIIEIIVDKNDPACLEYIKKAVNTIAEKEKISYADAYDKIILDNIKLKEFQVYSCEQDEKSSDYIELRYTSNKGDNHIALCNFRHKYWMYNPDNLYGDINKRYMRELFRQFLEQLVAR